MNWFAVACFLAIIFPPSLFVTVPIGLLVFVSRKRASETAVNLPTEAEREELRTRLQDMERALGRPLTLFERAHAAASSIGADDPVVPLTSALAPVASKQLAPSAVHKCVVSASSNWMTAWEAKCQSPAEVAFLRAAINAFDLHPDGDSLKGEIELRLQHFIGPVHVDFLVKDDLVVEIDGHRYHSSQGASVRDARRDLHLRQAGFRVQRIPAYKVFNHPLAAIADVVERVEQYDEGGVDPG